MAAMDRHCHRQDMHYKYQIRTGSHAQGLEQAHDVDFTGTDNSQSNPTHKQIPTPVMARIRHVFAGLRSRIFMLRRIDQFGVQPSQQNLRKSCMIDIEPFRPLRSIGWQALAQNLARVPYLQPNRKRPTRVSL
jgi:hypothetical protein